MFDSSCHHGYSNSYENARDHFFQHSNSFSKDPSPPHDHGSPPPHVTENSLLTPDEDNGNFKYAILENCESTDVLNLHSHGETNHIVRVESVDNMARPDFFKTINVDNSFKSEEEEYDDCCSSVVSFLFCCFL